MKSPKILLSLLTAFLMACIPAFSQVGIGTATPNSKAVLDLKSPGNNQGFLAPRLTSSQRTATSFVQSLGPSEIGLLVFDIDTNKFYYWSGTSWTVIEDSTGTDNQTISYSPTTGTGGSTLSISGGNSIDINGARPGGIASGELVGSYPSPTIGSNAGSSINAAINNAATSGTINSNRLNSSVVLETESPASGDISGTFNAGFQLGANSVTSAEITDANVATADLANASVTDSKIASGVSVAKLSASATNGQVLTTVAGATTWSTPTSGTVTNIATGSGLTGGPITSTGTLSLSNTTVTAGSYGSGTQVAQFNVDSQGRITNAINVTITGATPVGTASGELAGSYPSPTIGSNAGSSINAAINNAATSGTINSNRLNSSVVLETESPASGDISGTFNAGFQLGANSVTSAEITDANVATADLANASVTDSKIASGVSVAKLSASATNGQVLTTVAGATTWSTPTSGTVTNIATGSGLTGGPITSTGTLSLSNTTVTAGSYGSGTQVAQFNVDSQGRITNAINVAITGAAPVGTASGELAGSYPSPTIGSNAGSSINAAINNAATSGTINSNRLNSSVVLETESPALGDISGTFNAGFQLGANSVTSAEITDANVATADLANASVTDSKIASGVSVAKLSASATNGQVLTTVAGSTTWASIPAVSGPASGDLSGSYPNPSVARIQSIPVASTAPVTGQVLKFNGSQWAPGADVSGGGGVSGSGVAGQLTYWNGSSNIGGSSNLVYNEKDSQVGINTAPTKTLDVNGSVQMRADQYVNITILPGSTANYSIKETDYIIIGETTTAKPADVFLPPSAANVGRVITVRATGSSASSGIRLWATDPDKVDGKNSYFLYFSSDATTYLFSITVVATEKIGWVSIQQSRNGSTN